MLSPKLYLNQPNIREVQNGIWIANNFSVVFKIVEINCVELF